MRTARPWRTLVELVVVASLVSSSVPASAPAPVRAGVGLLPDLGVAPLDDFRIENSGGQRLLRFTAMMVNIGSGHLEVRGARSSTEQPFDLDQFIFTDTSRSTVAQQVETSATAHFSGDGHDHWHVNEMTRFDLWSLDQSPIRSAKIGFCFLDSEPWNLSLPGAPDSRIHDGSGCGGSADETTLTMGISIGWGDEYAWSLPMQWVDITGLPAGSYVLRGVVDPHGSFVESNETNQCAWARISISSSDEVSLTDGDDTCVNDWTGTTFAADIRWVLDNEISVGCAPFELFCARSLVSREQMASFLARARSLVLPPSADHFIDDEGSVHEDNINRIADVGITVGCAPLHYCPKASITRAQMAAFLVRAFGLGPASEDYFVDDTGSQFEDDINRLREAGITLGCGPERFCPSVAVSREQMAAFLHRALTRGS